MSYRTGQFIEEYAKHALLNLGQACQGLRYFYSHPDIDLVATRGSFAHFLRSITFRTKMIANDLVFALLPPHWHHTSAELQSMHAVPLQKWFLAITLILNAKKGISSRQLARDLGVNKNTAWSMQMRIRRAMIDTPSLLSGIVEMDETYVGARKPRKSSNDKDDSGNYPKLPRGQIGRASCRERVSSPV